MDQRVKARMKRRQQSNRDVAFISRLREIMAKRDLTAIALADMAGLSHSYVSDLLAGRSGAPVLTKLRLLARALEVSVAYLVGEDDSEVPRDGPVPLVGIPHHGDVARGRFVVLSTEDRYLRMPGERSPQFPDADHFTMTIADRDMDQCAGGPLLPGDRVYFVALASAKLMVETGRLYVLRRTDDGGRKWEWLLRRAHVFADRTVFKAETSETVADIVVMTPVPIGEPDILGDKKHNVVAIGLAYSVSRNL